MVEPLKMPAGVILAAGLVSTIGAVIVGVLLSAPPAKGLDLPLDSATSYPEKTVYGNAVRLPADSCAVTVWVNPDGGSCYVGGPGVTRSNGIPFAKNAYFSQDVRRLHIVGVGNPDAGTGVPCLYRVMGGSCGR